MDEPVKISIEEAHALVKQGKKVTLTGNPDDYYCLRGPDDDPCIKQVGIWHHKSNGGWRTEQIGIPAPNEDWQGKNFEDVDDRVTYNQFIKDNPPKPDPE